MTSEGKSSLRKTALLQGLDQVPEPELLQVAPHQGLVEDFGDGPYDRSLQQDIVSALRKVLHVPCFSRKGITQGQKNQTDIH